MVAPPIPCQFYRHILHLRILGSGKPLPFLTVRTDHQIIQNLGRWLVRIFLANRTKSIQTVSDSPRPFYRYPKLSTENVAIDEYLIRPPPQSKELGIWAVFFVLEKHKWRLMESQAGRASIPS